METLKIKTTKNREVVDLTDRLNKHLKDKSAQTGACLVFITHSTAALATADLDPGTDQDMLDAFEAMMPKLRYRHPHDPPHVIEHILATLIGASVIVPIKDGRLVLGTWQSVVLFELSGPRERQILVSILTEAV